MLNALERRVGKIVVGHVGAVTYMGKDVSHVLRIHFTDAILDWDWRAYEVEAEGGDVVAGSDAEWSIAGANGSEFVLVHVDIRRSRER
jgi:hypothetical protein